MFTLYSLAIVAVLGTICSVLLYRENYKREARELFQGTWGCVGFILFIIMVIGLAPTTWG